MPGQPPPKLHTLRAVAPAVPPFTGPAYAELCVASNFSFLRGASHPDELVLRAAELGYRAVAITDRNSLAGVVRAHVAARQTGIKLIIGARLVLTDSPDILAWITDRAAYARLCRLLTLGKRRVEKGECSLSLNDLLDHAEGLLLAVVPPAQLVGEWAGVLPILRDHLRDRLSLAVNHSYDCGSAHRLATLADIAWQHDVPLVAVNDVHYHDPSRRLLQDTLACIREGCSLPTAGFRLFPNGERYLKPPEVMHRLFADYPDALRRTTAIAEQCTFALDDLRYEYPQELAPPGQTPMQHLRALTWQGAQSRYPNGIPADIHVLLERELELIDRLGYEAYFLTVHDIVTFARSKSILCQGRGSAANSAVCYCLGITAIDPQRIGVLFERFISAARNEPPDIDVDFEHERREEVIQYVYEKYGRERSGMTATVITYRGRSAVRDVGKALGLGLDLIDEMAKKLDGWGGGTITDPQLREVGLDPADTTVRLVVYLTSQLLGFPRHLSQHVGGMVMTRGPLCELVPIENAAMADRTVIEWDKDDIDALGILKVDILALGMLTAIARCLTSINAASTHRPPITLATIPAEDPAVYDMICDADTIGVFQIESRAQMSMLPRLRPREFYDLVIEVAIVRPGPIQGDMVHPYLRRRRGEEAVEFPSEALRSVLSKTLGVPLFQEQAMKVAIVAAGFTPEDADRLRRAMAAWRRNGSMQYFEDKFLRAMVANGYTPDFAQRCFNQIKGFSDYGFPESHAASFALLVYASCWLKRYHPAAFTAALLNSQPMGFYAPAQLVRDAREHGVAVLPVDVNHSDWETTLEGAAPMPAGAGEKRSWGVAGPALRLGLHMIKGLSSQHAQQIVAARADGPFTSVEDLARRTALPAGAMERLANADAFQSIDIARRTALWHSLAGHESTGLFAASPEPLEPAELPAMSLGAEVLTDYTVTTLSLKAHPVSIIRSQLARQRIRTTASLQSCTGGERVSVAGLVICRQRPETASGVLFMTIEDETGVANLIVWKQVYERYRTIARQARFVRVDGVVQREGQVIHIVTRRLQSLAGLLDCEIKSRDFH